MAKTTGSSLDTKPTHDEIAVRARAIYEQGGCIPGRDLQNWLQAETELRSSRNAVTAKPAATATRPAAPKTNSKSPTPKTPTPRSYA